MDYNTITDTVNFFMSILYYMDYNTITDTVNFFTYRTTQPCLGNIEQ
jgi:hypothetical protein